MLLTLMSIIICAMRQQCKIAWIGYVSFTAWWLLSKFTLVAFLRQPGHETLEYLWTHLLRIHCPILLRNIILAVIDETITLFLITILIWLSLVWHPTRIWHFTVWNHWRAQIMFDLLVLILHRLCNDNGVLSVICIFYNRANVQVGYVLLGGVIALVFSL